MRAHQIKGPMQTKSGSVHAYPSGLALSRALRVGVIVRVVLLTNLVPQHVEVLQGEGATWHSLIVWIDILLMEELSVPSSKR